MASDTLQPPSRFEAGRKYKTLNFLTDHLICSTRFAQTLQITFLTTMQSFILFIFPFLTPALATTGIFPTLSPCTLNDIPCSTGSICTQTETCRGLCLTSSTPIPNIPCTVGYNAPCPTGATCTPTMVCAATGACGGACIATNPPPPTSQPPPSITCVIGADNCPTGSFCSQTMVCGGLCLPTGPVITPTPTPSSVLCGKKGPRCPKDYKCRLGRDCDDHFNCYGYCVSV